MALPPEVEEYLRKTYPDIPGAVLSGPKVGPPPAEFVAAQDADVAAREDAQRQAVLGAAANAFAGRGWQMPSRVAPINENVRRYLEQQQAARASTVDPMEALKRAMEIRKGNLDAGKTEQEIEKLRQEAQRIGLELPGVRADSEIKSRLASPVTPEYAAWAKSHGIPLPGGVNFSQVPGAVDLSKAGQGLQIERDKSKMAKGEKADKTTSDLRKEFQGNQVYKDAQQIAASHAKVQSASPTAEGDIALVYGFMKILDPGSAVREGEYATAANAGGAFQKLGNVYNAVLKGDKLPQSVRDAMKKEAAITYQAQMKRYESLAAPYRDLAQKAGVNPDEVVLPFSSPTDAPQPSAPGSRPQRTVNGETREWDGSKWVPVGG